MEEKHLLRRPGKTYQRNGDGLNKPLGARWWNGDAWSSFGTREEGVQGRHREDGFQVAQVDRTSNARYRREVGRRRSKCSATWKDVSTEWRRAE